MAQWAIRVPKYPHSSLWPTREQYLWLLRQEASHQCVLFNAPEIEVPNDDLVWDEQDEVAAASVGSDAWFNERSADAQLSTASPNTQPMGYSRTTSSRERRTILGSYAWLYLDNIRENLSKQLLQAGATVSQDPCHLKATLYDVGTLWSATHSKSELMEEPLLRFGIFSDLRQEETTVEYVILPPNLSFESFKKQIAAIGIVRHLTSERYPDYASTLFLNDSIVYHHPHPTIMDPADPADANEIYPVTRDYGLAGNGWYSHVTSIDARSMVNRGRDWRPIDTEDDWQSLTRLLQASPSKVFMRHKSVEDRMDFIRRHREREELEIAKTGGCYLNTFLNRHMDKLNPCDKHDAVPHPEQNLSGEGWKRRVVDQSRRDGQVYADEIAFFKHL